MTLNLQSIKVFFKKHQTIIVFIIILAYVLRVLPYLLGYSLPYTEDGIRDFQQVQYLVDSGEINFNNSYHNFGAFPILHLLVYGISKLGFDPMKVFLFVPQIFASLGILFFYLFLKKYFSTKLSLLSCFLISVFGPHIHWSAQPTRETMGLFFFPLIIYLFDREITSSNIRKNVFNKILLATALILIIPTHHWSSIMIAGWLLFYSLFFFKKNKNLPYALFIIGGFLILAIIYWYFAFSLAFTLISSLKLLGFIQLIPGALFVVTGVFLLKKLDLNKIKNNKWQLIFFISILSVFILLGSKIAPVKYPIQIWMMFLIFLTCSFIGFFYSREKRINSIFLINIFYLVFWFITIPYSLRGWGLDTMPFDPFRTFEFAIFSVAPIAAAGFLKISKDAKYLMITLILFLIFLATLIYPSIFVYKNNFVNTIFYDIRSDIRYISDDVIDLISWANNHGYNVISPVPEIQSYQATFYPVQRERLIMETTANFLIKENYDYVADKIMKVSAPKEWMNNMDKANIKDSATLYSNKGGNLLVINYYDADFISQNVFNSSFIYSENIRDALPGAYIIIKNTGQGPWLPSEGYQLRSILVDSDSWNIDLPHPVFPGQTVKFVFDIPTGKEVLSTFVDNFESITIGTQWRMFKEGLGWFGEAGLLSSFTIYFSHDDTN